VTALSNMAAAARPPGLGDARVPCPLCGGLVHPVAGRCKHCKEDLAALRTNRPQAAAVLPALNGKGIVAPLAGNGTSVHSTAPTAVPIAVPQIDSAPILPQRPTGRSMSAQRPRGSLLRNWPLLVIILAMIAIVTAVVIMVLPTDNKGSGGKRQLMPAPAPDRMDTTPKDNDPWSGATPPSAPDPNTPDPAPQPRVTPDPPNPDPDNNPSDPDDMLGGLGPNTFGGTLGANNGAFLFTLAEAACKKAKSCPGADNSMLDAACQGLSNFPHPPASQCARGQKCVEAIERMDCSGLNTSSNPMSAMLLMQDCAQAVTEC